MEETNFEKWFMDNFKPCCYVYSTNSAKVIMKKNNLSPSEFLRPFADFTKKEIFFYSGEKLIQIKDLKVECFDSDHHESCISIKPECYYDYLISVLSNQSIYPEWSLHENKITKDIDKASVIFSKLKKNSFPWMNQIEKTYFECLQFNPAEFYQQPLFNVFMCSISDDPECFSKENRELMKPVVIKTGIYEDPNISIIILLNDNSEKVPGVQKAEVQSKFQNANSLMNVKLWDINSAKDEENRSKDIWSYYFHNIDKYNKFDNIRKNETLVYGQLISKNEQTELMNDFFNIFNQHIVTLIQGEIPKLEGQINDLKGSWFFSNKNDPKIEFVEKFNIHKLKEVDKYRMTLGMIYFYFRDYENVLIVFKKIDTKTKTYERYLPFINHIASICQFILSNGRYYKSEFDKSYNEFQRAHLYGQSFRAIIIMIKMFEHMKMYEEIRINLTQKENQMKKNPITLPHFEKVYDCLLPIWLEKASLSFMINKNCYRKFCLIMVRAGDKYAKINPIKTRYAINAYGWMIYFIDNVSFSFIRLKDYLNRKMGDLCREIKYYEAAHRFYKNCLELSKYKLLPAENQQSDLKYFLETLENYSQQKTIKLGVLNTSTLTIPEIANTTVLIIEEQDYAITQMLEHQETISHLPWTTMNKYAYVQLKKSYANLSENDLIILRLLDEIVSTERRCCNLYSRRNFQGQVNEKIHVSFVIQNPLKTDINIEALKLICEFRPEVTKEDEIIEDTSSLKNMIDYEIIQLLLNPEEKKRVELYCKPLAPGQIIIKGVSMKLNQVVEIQHCFNQKNLSKLYSYRTRLTSIHSDQERGRRSTISSHNSGFIQDTINKKKKILNRKADLIYDALSEQSNIQITFPLGTKLEMYHNELIMIPMIIENNSNHKIKRFSIFTIDSINSSKFPHSYLCENIFKEIELIDRNKKIEIYLPFVPLFIHLYYLKIIIKFEEEAIIKQMDIRRFVININVKPSIRFVFNEEIFNMETITTSNETINFNMKTFAFVENKDSLNNLEIGSIIHNSEFSLTNEIKWKHLFDDSADKLYTNISCMKLTTTYAANESKNQIKGSVIDNLTEAIHTNQSHIKKKFTQIAQNECFLFNWSAIEKGNKTIKGIYVYKPLLNLPELTESFLQVLVSHSIQFNVKQYSLNKISTIVALDILFNKICLYEIVEINKYKFSIPNSNQEFKWLGLKKFLINNQIEKNNNSSEVKLRFSFITKVKGEINVNKIKMKFYLSNIKQSNLKLLDAPYPIIINIK